MTTNEHPLLAKILASVSSTNTYNHHWGQLRREVFPGEDSWARLQAWAAEHNLECQLTFTQSSKGAELQFRRLGRSAAIDAQNPALEPVAPGTAALEDVSEENLGDDEAADEGEEGEEEVEEAAE
jgi:hypothetical protein